MPGYLNKKTSNQKFFLNNTAFNRGVRMAKLCKKLTTSASFLNTACLRWTDKRGLHAVMGRLPVPIAVFAILTVVIVSGLFIGTALLIGTAFIYMLSNLVITRAEDNDAAEEQSGHQYREGDDGFGIYSGPQNVNVTSSRIDSDEDDD